MARRKRPLSQNIGSVSTGTMREEDLIPDFIWELKQQSPPSRAHRKLIREIESRIESDSSGDDDTDTSNSSGDNEDTATPYYESDAAGYDLESLFDALGEYAPEYFYFGSHPGDGSDYGWWRHEDWDTMLTDNGGIKLSDSSEIPADHYGLVAVVNDHGNVSLYRRARNHRLIHLWSVV